MWKCSCGILNAGINKNCAGIKHYQTIEHYQVTPNKPDFLMTYLAGRELNLNFMARDMTEQEQLFAKFFSDEKVLIALMTAEERIDHIQQLEEIAFEAKARLTAGKEYAREENAKGKAKGRWLISPTEPDQTVTDTINRVKIKRDKMTKLDRQSEKLKDLGFTAAEVEAMTAGLRKAATKNTQEEVEQTIKRTNAVQKEIQKGMVSPENNPMQTKPADLSTLKFG